MINNRYNDNDKQIDIIMIIINNRDNDNMINKDI